MRIGFIGCGNMGYALMSGVIKSGCVGASEVFASDVSKETLNRAKTQLQVTALDSNSQVAAVSDILVFAVKPQFLEDVIEKLDEGIPERTLIISLAPGKTLKWLSDRVGDNHKIIRVMPNTPALVECGMMALCPNSFVTKNDMKNVKMIFEAVGRCEVVPENLMDAVTGVSGSSPAFVFMMIEAMADAAVAEGMPRKQAYTFAAQSVYGSAKLFLESGKHPGELKDMVCSPGGTTIEGVNVLEDAGFRSAVMNAVRVAAEKSRGM